MRKDCEDVLLLFLRETWEKRIVRSPSMFERDFANEDARFAPT